MRSFAFFILLTLNAQVRQHPPGAVRPHEKYVRVVPESVSPVERVYIPAKDGLYIAAAIRKPAGNGPFPVLLYFHGAPGGRGMEKLVSWSLGTTGGPLWERFLQEGYVVVVADYRNNHAASAQILPRNEVTYADDGISVLDYVLTLPYVDKTRVSLYGVSRGGNLSLDLVTRPETKGKIRALILGAAAPRAFLAALPESANNVHAPVLILIGTADGLYPQNRFVYESLSAAKKTVEMEVYENGYHDFVAGPQGHAGRDEPLLASTLDALEKALDFLRRRAR